MEKLQIIQTEINPGVSCTETVLAYGISGYELSQIIIDAIISEFPNSLVRSEPMDYKPVTYYVRKGING